MSLSGRNALVTGVSRRAGIGYAVARRLLEARASVFIHGWRAHDALQQWGSEPGGTEGVGLELGVPFLEVNLADPDAPEDAVASATDAVARSTSSWSTTREADTAGSRI